MLDGAEACLDDARRAASFIRSMLWDAASRTLRRRYRQGESGIEAYAEDYAYLIFGLLELFQADGDPAWLEWAIDLQRRQDELFWDEAGGGWFSTTGHDSSVLLRVKEDYDGAEPSASSVAVLNLEMLAHLVADDALFQRLERALATFGGRAAGLGRAAPMLLAGLSAFHQGPFQIVLAGERSATGPLMAVLRQHYLPAAITVPLFPEHRVALSRLLPWTGAMTGVAATAYVCRGFVCDSPITTAQELDRAVSRIVNRDS